MNKQVNVEWTRVNFCLYILKIISKIRLKNQQILAVLLQSTYCASY